ncbi:VOC family protein [Actinomadura sp. NPDC047616]|uniref:VOC family protein n=1 Tax=Actinomadura sp. NPDC047616 TaxID=3155914 RepID=UPI0033EB1666
MTSRISELVIGCADPDRLAAFWSELLGYVELGREDDGSIEIGPPDARFRQPAAHPRPQPQQRPAARKVRLHIDVNPTDRDQDAELERLLALGARVDSAWRRVMARPDRRCSRGRGDAHPGARRVPLCHGGRRLVGGSTCGCDVGAGWTRVRRRWSGERSVGSLRVAGPGQLRAAPIGAAKSFRCCTRWSGHR